MKVKKILNLFLAVCFTLVFATTIINSNNITRAVDTTKKYYTIYSDDTKQKVLFLKGDEVLSGDMYLSTDNKLYEIVSVDEETKEAIAKFLRDEELPKYNVTRNVGSKNTTSAESVKRVGIYHTHNDESYYTPDGYDSVYGKGGIHDVGKALSDNFNKLGIQTVYREDLHLPHNSGAYTRSQVTASSILNQGVDAMFDIHRDSTKRSEYLTKVDGQTMSSVRMVIGAASTNYEENKKFAYSIKSYADQVYPGLIKDIYIGKGNYNQQLSNRAMLFEFGCENIEKDYAIKATEYVAKVLDVVLYGSSGASKTSMSDVTLASSNGENATIAGLVNDSGTVNSNSTLYVVLGIVGVAILVLVVTLLVSKRARYKVGRFFSEMFAGIFGKKSAR